MVVAGRLVLCRFLFALVVATLLGSAAAQGESVSSSLSIEGSTHATTVGTSTWRGLQATPADVAAGEALLLRLAAGPEASLPIAPYEAPDLASAMQALYRALGITYDRADVDSIASRASALPDELEAPIAELVMAVSAGSESQEFIGRALADDLFLGAGAGRVSASASSAAVAAMAEIQLGLRTAMDTFTQRTAPAWPAISASGASNDHLFEDPFGLVVIGGLGNDRFDRPVPIDLADGRTIRDPVLQVDPAGDDVYLNSAGGACPGVAPDPHECNGLFLSLVLDLNGNDRYEWNAGTAAVQGAGSMGGQGLLVDRSGDDQYHSAMRLPSGDSSWPPGDQPGLNFIGGGAQGFGQAGMGLLWDSFGDDVYQMHVDGVDAKLGWSGGQGYGSLGGVGLLADDTGDDSYRMTGKPSQGRSNFLVVSAQGAAWFGGLGGLIDTGSGLDSYVSRMENNDYLRSGFGISPGVSANGFGVYGGIGIAVNEGDDDRYERDAIGRGRTVYIVTVEGLGAGFLGGAGIFHEASGNDYYRSVATAVKGATVCVEGCGAMTSGYGSHIDGEGDDYREARVEGQYLTWVLARGFVDATGVGSYLDLGGDDQYIGPGRNNDVWIGGADISHP